MRSFDVRSMALAGALLVSLVPRAPMAAPQSTLEGDWETVIASPKRPWIFVTHFRRVGDAWNGTMTVVGLGEFPLRDVRAESTWVHFKFPPALDSMIFQGTLNGAEVTGRVEEVGHPTPTRLRRCVSLRAPSSRREAWGQDLDFAATHLSEYDRSFTPGAREAFQRAIARLKLDLSHDNDAQVLVALSRAVALGGNAHTRLRLDPTRQGSFATEFPLRVWWFSDGAYVVKAAPQYRRALGSRVVAVEGRDLSAAREAVTGLFAGNDAWADYLSPIYLTCPDVLYGLGMTRSRGRASFTLEDARGSRFTLQVNSEPVHKDAAPAESWQELSPLMTTGKPPWVPALAHDPSRVPLYLRHPERAYWFEFLPGAGLLYFQFNRSGDDEVGPSFHEFADSLLAFARRHPIRDVVVDLRFNSGGNLEVARAFMKSLGREEKLNRRGHLFVIVGHCTFSAGLYHAAQMKQFTRATFIGEPVGDHLDYWAEGGEILLPNSRAAIEYSNGFHRYSGRDYPEYRPYYEELHVSTLAPDVPAPLRSTDYFSGRDPALEAVATHSRRP